MLKLLTLESCRIKNELLLISWAADWIQARTAVCLNEYESELVITWNNDSLKSFMQWLKQSIL